MRDIKFRAWDKKKSVMDNWLEVQEMIAIHYAFHNDDYVLMQYTGLKDKNGVEIYEGDIANITLGLIEKGGYTERGVMKWNEKKAQFGFECKDSLFNHALESPDFKIEIIGNIHENPELISKAEGK